jgi:outer membrane protein
MKKSFAIIALAISIISCNNAAEVKEVKTAYIDTSKLMDEYTEAKDINEKYKNKTEEIGRKLEVEEANFKSDAAYFQKNAQSNGQAWAQQKGAELQKRQQELQYTAQTIAQQLQQEHAVEIDSLVVNVKKFIREYGKEKGYSYIYGTGEQATVLYAEDKYDITNEIVKLLNDKYKPSDKKETKEAPKKEEDKK